MIIKTNYRNVITRLFILIMLSVIIGLIVYYGIITQENHSNTFPLYIIVFFFTLIFIGLSLSLFGVIKVVVDHESAQLEFSRFFLKRQVPSSELFKYYRSVYHTKKGITYGLILKTNDLKIIELNPANLQSVMILEDYLRTLKVEYLGELSSSYPFTSAL